MFAALMIAASLLAADPAPEERLTVADVVKSLVLDETKFSYSDEPPGKLRAVECVTMMGKVKVRVRVEVVYFAPDLFSDSGKWDIKKVRAATVLKVTIEPEPQFPKAEPVLPPPSKGK
jgi:hypothetical protein